MTPRPAPTAGVHAALASATRRHLLELLQAGEAPRDVHDLARAVGLHPSTVRFHVETLRRAGLVVRQEHPYAGIGRPRTAYAAAVPGPWGSGYEGLAALLAADLADTAEEREARAERIGMRWADRLLPDRRDTETTVDDATAVVSGVFDRIGFAPQVSKGADGCRIALHSCPFRAVAREHPEVVCAMHLGLLRGSLERLGAGAVGRLTPFVEPEKCMAEIDPVGVAGQLPAAASVVPAAGRRAVPPTR